MDNKVISDDIDGATRQGHEELAKGNVDEACNSFERAVELAEGFKEGFTERACYFNLGACYVAKGDAKRGVECLLKAFPPEKDADGITNYADLQYNLATAYDALGEISKAVDCYKIAAEEYKTQGNRDMQGETLLKLANGCTTIGKIDEAIETYQQASEIFEEIKDIKTRLLVLNNLASLLAEKHDIESCSKVLTQVIELCVDVDDVTLKGKVYNDIGLLYSGLNSYQNAAECFELALPLMQTSDNDNALEAVLQQNLGAVYNQLKEFGKSMECHRKAVSLHGESSNTSAQGQAYCNMGFAQSQLGEYGKAGESFMHAIQAAKDCGDERGLWQAYEGLAAVSFLEQDYVKAVEYYKSALSVLSATGETNHEHSNRIIGKLADALECQLVFTKRVKNGKLPPLRIDRSKTDHREGKRDVKNRRIGRTRTRKEHHKLIARGIDGDQTTSESEESVDGSSSGSDKDSREEKSKRKRTEVERNQTGKVVTTEAEVHPFRRTRNTVSTDSSREESSVKEIVQQGKRSSHPRTPVSVSQGGTLLDGSTGKHSEEPVDDVDNSRASPARSDYSDEMPRAHREAYLASVHASRAPSPTPNGNQSRNGSTVQSKTCIIQ